MALTLTYRTVCDVCLKLIGEESYAVMDGQAIPHPKKYKVMGADCCDECWEPLSSALNSAVESVRLRRKFRPLKTRLDKQERAG